jgi:hypothetical protein
MAKRMGFLLDYMDTATVTVDPGNVVVSVGLHSHGQVRRPSPRSSQIAGVLIEAWIAEGDTGLAPTAQTLLALAAFDRFRGQPRSPAS